MSEFKPGDVVYNGWGKEVTLVRVGKHQIGFKHSVKCRHAGCKKRKTGYLTQGAGGGAFYTKSGEYLCDLRNQEFDCGEH